MELNEDMFVVVTDSYGMFIVCESWLFEQEGKTYTYYPSGRGHENDVKKKKRHSTNWNYSEVAVLKRNIATYKLAEQALNTRIFHEDSESEVQHGQKRIKLVESSNKIDYNALFDEPVHESQNVQNVVTPTTVVNNLSSISDATTVYVPEPLTQELSNITYNIIDSDLEVINQSQFAQVNERLNKIDMEIAEIKRAQQEQAKVSKYLNEKMDLILDILQRNLKEPTTKESATEEELDFFVDLPINTKDNLETFENKLKIYDVQPLLDLKFKKQRENLVLYLAKRIFNVKPKADLKNGLPQSLFRLYFSENFFFESIGWSGYSERIDFSKFTGHHTLIYEVINTHTPNAYTNLDEAKTFIHKAIRSIHEDRNKIARLEKKKAINQQTN